MTLLNILYNKLFTKKKIDTTEVTDTNLSASILVGIDEKQQYYFDIKWVHHNDEQTSSDLANLILGLTYGLFTEQIKNTLLDYDISDKPRDAKILVRTIEILKERSEVLQNIMDKNIDGPIVRPSEVFRNNETK